MNEKPILFSTPMVRAILDGRKTMTRRIMKVQPPDGNYKIVTTISTTGDKRKEGKHHWVELDGLAIVNEHGDYFSCPYGQVGDRLWVRETFWLDEGDNQPFYKAQEEHPEIFKWKPSIFMPRWASRITLEITNVRVERLQDITDKDSEREGIGRQMAHEQDLGWRNYLWHGDFGSYGGGNKQTDAWPYQYSTYQSAKDCFSSLWELINGKTYPWASNPWVWVIEFNRMQS